MSSKALYTLCKSLPYKASDRHIIDATNKLVLYATTPSGRIDVRNLFIALILRLIKAGCPLNQKMVERVSVVAPNHISIEPIIICLIEKGCVVTTEILERLCRCKHSTCVVSMINNRTELTSRMLEYATEHVPNKALLNRLISYGCPISSQSVVTLISSGNYELAEMLIKNGCPMTEKMISLCCNPSQESMFSIFNTLVRLGCPMPSSVLENIIDTIYTLILREHEGDPVILKATKMAELLILNGCNINQLSINMACKWCPSIFEMMYEVFEVKNSPELLYAASKCGNIFHVKKLLELNCPFDSTLFEIIRTYSTTINDVYIAKYLCIFQLFVGKVVNTMNILPSTLVDIVASYTT